MSELGELYRAWDKTKKEKKAKNRRESTAMLDEKGLNYDVKNGGTHLIVKHADKTTDFWPSTGKFIVRGGKTGRGVRNLFKELQI